MYGVTTKDGIIFVNDNPAGYVRDQTCVVMDMIFQRESLEQYLEKSYESVAWKEGVFEQLSLGGALIGKEAKEPLKQVRIWQLKKELEYQLRFATFEQQMETYGIPSKASYDMVFDGTIATNDLEVIYQGCSEGTLADYQGQSMKVSDIIELYDETRSVYYVVERFGFQSIAFEEESISMQQSMEEMQP